MRYICFLMFSLCSLLSLTAQNSAQDLIANGQYEVAYQQLSGQLDKDQEDIDALLGLVLLFSDDAYSGYSPDQAHTLLRKAQRVFRGMKPKWQEKLEEKGQGRTFMRKQKELIRQKGFEYHFAKGTSQAMAFYKEHYRRLPHELETAANNAFLKFYFYELSIDNRYDSLKYFALTHREDMEEYQPELLPQVEDAVFKAYFVNKDSTALKDLIGLLKDYPDATSRVDEPLSRALKKAPYVTMLENQIRGLNRRRLPKTIKVIYLYHFYTGEWSDLIGFQNRYPEYADSFNIQRAITLAKAAPDIKSSYKESQYELYDNYIRLAAPTQKAYRALQQLIKSDIDEERWTEAVTKVEKYQPFFGEQDKRVNGLIKILQQAAENVQPISLGDKVNSYEGEYAPVISADGQQLFFCRNIEGNEEIFVSELINGEWDYPEPISELNTDESHEAPLAISTDGSTLMMYDGGVVEYTEKGLEGWSKPVGFFKESLKPEWQGVTTFSADRSVAIFAAKTIDVIGTRNDENIDLFIAYKQDDGHWGSPINLGTTLNTPFEDRCPFLHPDMRTMYFSSSGHAGLGKLDVYMTKRIGEGWTNWSAPVNLGKAINFPGHDWGYRISTDGSTAYFSTSVPYRREDLYQISIPEPYRPQPVSVISGLVTGLDGVPLNATLQISDLDTGEEIKVVRPDPESGKFIITLPAGKLYSYTVTGDLLYPISNNIDLREEKPGVAIQEEIKVPTLEEIQEGGLVLPLKNLFFDTDKFTIKSISYKELNQLADLVKQYNLKVEIAGHTDNVGTAQYNLELSQNRAAAARQYLIEQGINTEQITAKGYGFTQPLNSNETAIGRAQNRRVEIRFKKE